MRLLPLPRLARSPHTFSLFSRNKAGIDKARRKLELALLVTFFGQQFVGGCRFGSTPESDRGRWTWAESGQEA